jgi:hypothetical protein
MPTQSTYDRIAAKQLLVYIVSNVDQQVQPHNGTFLRRATESDVYAILLPFIQTNSVKKHAIFSDYLAAFLLAPHCDSRTRALRRSQVLFATDCSARLRGKRPPLCMA